MQKSYKLLFIYYQTTYLKVLPRLANQTIPKHFHSHNLKINSVYPLPNLAYNSSSESLIFTHTIKNFPSSHYLSALKCMDIIERNSLLIIPGSERVKYDRIDTHIYNKL